MRINPSTGQIVSYDDNFCFNCDSEIDWNYPYCDNCGEYVGVVGEVSIEVGISQEDYDAKINEIEEDIKKLEKEIEKLKDE